MELDPTPERLAIAHRAAGREWTVGPEGAVAMTTDPVLSEMVVAGYVHLVFRPAHLLADDYWHLTEAGRDWLARHAAQPGEPAPR